MAIENDTGADQLALKVMSNGVCECMTYTAVRVAREGS